jgi:uncharacterized membrane protein
MTDLDPYLSPGPNPRETLVEMSRLKGLSDGIFAFALTLLVLDLRLPENVLEGDLFPKLIGLAPNVLVFLIGFVIIGGAWGSHQRMLAQIKQGDGLLAWINLFSLLSVSLVPATAALLSRFPGVFVPQACFAINAVLIQLTAKGLWQHASRHELTDPTLDTRVVVSIGRRLNLGAIVFGLSIPLALLSTTLVYIIWVGTFIMLFTTDWLSWQQAIRVEQASIPLAGASRARIRVRHLRGQLNIGAQAAMPDLLQGVFGGGLEQQINQMGEDLEVQLTSAGHARSFMNIKFPWAWGPANLLDWTLRLRPQIPIALEIMLASGQARLELSELQITELNLTALTSSMLVALPTHAGQTKVKVQASRLSLILQVPPEVGAHIQTNPDLANVEIDLARFPKTEQAGEYRSMNYDTATQHVDILLEAAGGSLQIF